MNNKKGKGQGRNQNGTEVYKLNIESISKNSSKLYCIAQKFG